MAGLPSRQDQQKTRILMRVFYLQGTDPMHCCNTDGKDQKGSENPQAPVRGEQRRCRFGRFALLLRHQAIRLWLRM